MKNYISKSGVKFIIGYTLLVILAFIFLLASMENNAFAYIYLIFLTIPWSLILAIISMFYEGIGEMSLSLNIFLFVFFIAQNCLFINLICLKYDREK